MLRALIDHYDQLVKKGILPRYGYELNKCGIEITIDENGEILDVRSLLTHDQRNSKDFTTPSFRPTTMSITRDGTVGGTLIEYPNYTLSLGSIKWLKEENKYDYTESAPHFNAQKKFIEELFGETASEAGLSLIKFYEKWEPSIINSSDLFLAPEIKDDFLTAVKQNYRIDFRYMPLDCDDDGSRYCEIPDVCEIWEEHLKRVNDAESIGVCMITGETGPIRAKHRKILGFPGAKGTGAKLISGNTKTIESYGFTKDSKSNPVYSIGCEAADKYVLVINYMLSRRTNRISLGDKEQIFYWCESGNTVAEEVASYGFDNRFGANRTEGLTDEHLRNAMECLAKGESVTLENVVISPNEKFHILALVQNGATIATDFHIVNDLGRLAANLQAHHDRCSLWTGASERKLKFSLYHILKASSRLTNEGKTDMDSITVQYESAIMKSILFDKPYPEALATNVMDRIRKPNVKGDEKQHRYAATYEQIALLKAFILKNDKNTERRERVQQYSTERNGDAYPIESTATILGRIFRLMEEIAVKSNNGKSNMAVSYIGTASSSPALAFPALYDRTYARLNKLSNQSSTENFAKYAKNRLDNWTEYLKTETGWNIPAKLNRYEKMEFYLGYGNEGVYRGKKTTSSEETLDAEIETCSETADDSNLG